MTAIPIRRSPGCPCPPRAGGMSTAGMDALAMHMTIDELAAI